ncbi:MAG: YhbY family RNA-binding protein [Archaeoglobaceae archaeon]|nr:YhbY family RNA-binding protein [Archaeoglobaceae archaeon]MDW7989728.1 YhbY family RNA-binding protein [Archaeoglobaceae archaeon]
MEIVRVNVGKNGLTESLLNEIKLLLEKKSTVEVKLLKNFSMRSEKEWVVNELKEKLNCRIKDVRGFVITLER